MKDDDLPPDSAMIDSLREAREPAPGDTMHDRDAPAIVESAPTPATSNETRCSHELDDVLTVIMGYSDLLLDQDLVTPTQRMYVRHLKPPPCAARISARDYPAQTTLMLENDGAVRSRPSWEHAARRRTIRACPTCT